jgi:hypothetical protein
VNVTFVIILRTEAIIATAMAIPTQNNYESGVVVLESVETSVGNVDGLAR